MTALETLNHFRSHGVSPSQAHALLAMAEGPPLKISDLAAAIGISIAGASQTADALEKQGLAQRKKGHDHRVNFVIPTARALKILQPQTAEA